MSDCTGCKAELVDGSEADSANWKNGGSAYWWRAPVPGTPPMGTQGQGGVNGVLSCALTEESPVTTGVGQWWLQNVTAQVADGACAEDCSTDLGCVADVTYTIAVVVTMPLQQAHRFPPPAPSWGWGAGTVQEAAGDPPIPMTQVGAPTKLTNPTADPLNEFEEAGTVTMKYYFIATERIVASECGSQGGSSVSAYDVEWPDEMEQWLDDLPSDATLETTLGCGPCEQASSSGGGGPSGPSGPSGPRGPSGRPVQVLPEPIPVRERVIQETDPAGPGDIIGD